MNDTEKLAKLAEAMGWTVHQKSRPVSGNPPKDVLWREVPPFLTSADAALTLVDALAKEGWSAELLKTHPDRWGVRFDILRELLLKTQSASAPTLAAAICEAFAKVKGLW